MPRSRSCMRVVWRPFAAFALALAFISPAWSAPDAGAQESLPVTATAAPESAVLYHVTDLDRDGAQWQQTEALLARVGFPDPLARWEGAILETGEQRGDISEAELDALLGGELAIVVLPVAVEQFAAKAMAGLESDTMFREEDAAPVASDEDEAHGVAAILRPGDPDAAWDYVQRQFADLAAEQGVSVEETTYGEAEVLSLPAIASSESPGMEDVSMQGLDGWMGGHHLAGGGAAARAGDFIVAGSTEADVAPIVDVIDGASGSLADSGELQAVASELPDEALSFTYVDGQAALDALDPEAIAMLQSAMPEVPVELWGSQSGLSISADDPGFRFDTITIYPESIDLDPYVAANDPAVAFVAEQAPGGTFAFQAGRLAENAYAGAPYAVAQLVNAAESGEEWSAEQGTMTFPTEDELRAEIDAASATLGFDVENDLFALLGDEIVAFSSFPSLSFEDFGVDAVAAVTATDPDALAETMQKIAAWIDRADATADVSTRQVGEATVYVVSDGEMEGAPGLEFGVVNERAVVGLGGGIEALTSEPAELLADDEQFQTVQGLLPANYSQISYVDIGQAIDPIVNLLGMVQAMQGTSEPHVAATPVADGGSPQNIRALGAVSFRDGNVSGSSGILYIGE